MENAESSSRQQSQRDLIRAHENYYNINLKALHPVYKRKKITEPIVAS